MQWCWVTNLAKRETTTHQATTIFFEHKNMKINTKTLTPIKDCSTSKIADNKNLPPNPTTDDGSLGRVLTFIPTLIWTPVLSSKRIETSTPAAPRLTEEEMNEVCSKLSELFVSSKKEESKEEEKECSMKPEFGRYKKTITFGKTETPVEVIRSIRLEA